MAWLPAPKAALPLWAHGRPDGSITFTSPDGAVLFTVGVPVMYDSDGKSSSDIAVSMVQTKKTVEVTYTPSADWLNDEERVYPVTIDTTVCSCQCTSNITDLSVYYFFDIDNNVFSTGEYLYMGMDYYNYIKFNTVPTIPYYETINSSALVFHGDSFSPEESLNSGSVVIGNLSQYWDINSFSSEEGYFNQDNLPEKTQTVTVSNLFFDETNNYMVKMSLDSFYSDISSYESFYSSSYGFEINLYYELDFRAYSSEYRTSAFRPCITVTYGEEDPPNIIPNGSYYISIDYAIENSGSKRLYLNNDSYFELFYDNISSNQVWDIGYCSNGYYTIKSGNEFLRIVFSADDNEYVLTTSSDNVQLDEIYWDITQVYGGYKITPKLYSNSVITLNSENGFDGIHYYACLNDINDSTEYSWQLTYHSTDLVTFVGINDSGHDHYSCFGDISDTMAINGQTGVNIRVANSITMEMCLNLIGESNIFVSRSHGNYNANTTYIELGNNESLSGLDILSKFFGSSENLDNLELALFVGCYTGSQEGVSNGLLRSCTSSGASYAVGFNDEINCTAANIWTTLFFKNYTFGSNPTDINDHIRYAATQYSTRDTDSYGYGFDALSNDTITALIAMTNCFVCITGG